ncbi:RNA-directed DNA polymerase, eukaryota, Reverse transcriptase zinc-binding domain protein [Artemisia annua]|uniref:RNA-directed DNA polymerase, eukaryota, Reverse transcriptase zinc-binding domain protein n=1 Tax=Artemisia annua TaxID=35608 RepID=A0A2U1N372_ARTAN|nr:RNA-directed DNA polymerase, eukaryota, Reverse transcriptase zinc-binding domain protein [Artemisia annua]
MVLVEGIWSTLDMECTMINVYAPQDINRKRALWNDLATIVNRTSGGCVVFGDFNVVRCVEERSGTIFCHRSAEAFNDLIDHSELIDIPMGGKKFSRVNSSGNKMSRLDRFLVSEAVVDRSPNLTCLALDRKRSDHCPLLLKEERNDYGPNSFKIFNSWMEMDGFDEMVMNSCMEFQPDEGDSKCVVLKNKLKFVKSKIKLWYAQKRSDQMGQRKVLESRLGEIDQMIDDGQGSDDIMSERRDLLHKAMELDRIVLKDIAQKSKKKWIKEGDENTKLFHGMLKRKRRKKNISGVAIDGDWVTNPQLVKEAFREHYANKFKSFSDIPEFVNVEDMFQWIDGQGDIPEFVNVEDMFQWIDGQGGRVMLDFGLQTVRHVPYEYSHFNKQNCKITSRQLRTRDAAPSNQTPVPLPTFFSTHRLKRSNVTNSFDKVTHKRLKSAENTNECSNANAAKPVIEGYLHSTSDAGESNHIRIPDNNSSFLTNAQEKMPTSRIAAATGSGVHHSGQQSNIHQSEGKPQ